MLHITHTPGVWANHSPAGNPHPGTTSDAINAIDFAVQLKKGNLANVRVLSNSWGGGG